MKINDNMERIIPYLQKLIYSVCRVPERFDAAMSKSGRKGEKTPSYPNSCDKNIVGRKINDKRKNQ